MLNTIFLLFLLKVKLFLRIGIFCASRFDWRCVVYSCVFWSAIYLYVLVFFWHCGLNLFSEMRDNDGEADSDDVSDYQVPQIVNPKRMAPKTSANKKKRNRKIVFAWDRQTESALIAAVQKEPSIWDSNCEGYKNLNSKTNSWKQVAAELNIEGVQETDARLKWQALRSHFKAYLSKIRARKSDQADIATVSWPHLSKMMFIEPAEVTQPCPSTCTIKLEDAYNDASSFTDLTRLTNPQSSLEDVKLTPIPKRVRRIEGRATTPMPSASLPSNSNSGSMSNLTTEVLENATSRQDERYDIFGRLVALHLRRLPDDVAFSLEGRIMQMIYSFPPELPSPPLCHRRFTPH